MFEGVARVTVIEVFTLLTVARKCTNEEERGEEGEEEGGKRGGRGEEEGKCGEESRQTDK